MDWRRVLEPTRPSSEFEPETSHSVARIRFSTRLVIVSGLCRCPSRLATLKVPLSMCTGSSSAVETSSSRNFNTYPKISSEVEFYQASSYLTCLPPGFLLSTRLPMTSPFTALRSCTHLILLNGVASASFLSWMDGIVDKNCMVEPLEAAEDDLLVVHTESYLKSLESSLTVSKIVEVPPVAQLPNILVQQKVLQPLRVQVGGTILAAKLAKEWGCAVNIGGGFHHCSADKGGGFCVYADISLCIHFAFLWLNISRVMIIDLDAHQGNGHEKDFSTDRRVYILDMYNPEIYPFDFEARRYIDRKIEVASGTATNEYLEKLDEALEVAGCMFDPELVIYNAGTDILDGDPLGMLKISPNGIATRDEKVFRFARKKNVPLVMLTSGGYMKCSARIIADSLANLFKRGLIDTRVLRGKV